MKVIDYKCEALSNLIWKNDGAIALIYDRKRGTIQKNNVDALVMQLLVRLPYTPTEFNPRAIQTIACWEGTHHAQKAKFKY
jgi:hypothetical protein